MTALRIQFLAISLVICVGIALTGFDRVHWFLYVPAAALAFAGAT